MLKIAIISDIHSGPDAGTKKGGAAPELLKQFATFVNEEKPDFMIDLGDRINAVDREKDIASLTDVAKRMKQILVPRVHILGNHDIDFLSQEDNERILDCSFSSYHQNIKNTSCIFWNGNVHMDEETGLALDPSDIEWLEKTLHEVEYPAIVFSHVPLDNNSMAGNIFFEFHREKSHEHYPPAQGEQCRAIIERSGKVIACINGHTHWSVYSSINDVHHVTLPSLTETLLTNPDPYAAWTLLQIEGQSLSIEIFGNDPEKYTLPIRKKTRVSPSPQIERM